MKYKSLYDFAACVFNAVSKKLKCSYNMVGLPNQMSYIFELWNGEVVQYKFYSYTLYYNVPFVKYTERDVKRAVKRIINAHKKRLQNQSQDFGLEAKDLQ